MLEDIQTVFSFLAVLLDMVEKLYTECALFYVMLYLLGVACLVRLVYWVAGAGHTDN